MKVLFTSLPATGHFNSILPVALAVRRAGHEIGVCCAPHFAPRLEELGFRHFPGGASSLEELLPPEGRSRFGSRVRRMQLEVFAGAAPDRLMPALVRAVEDWRPDVLVRESSEFAACILAERLGMPHAAVITGSSASHERGRRFYARALDALRERHGLGPDPGAGMMHRYLTFSLMPPRWDGDEAVPATMHHVRYESPATAAPDWLQVGGERPLVLAALGTLMYGEPGLLEAIVEAVGQLPVDAIVAIGRDQDPTRFGAAPGNVRLEPWVPQIAILAHAALFVTHGGFNSTKEALSHGVPLVVIPIGAEQPYTAGRVEALGLGRAVAAEERTAPTIRERVEEVLREPRYARNARALAAEIRALPPLSRAVDLLERLVAERQPILREPASGGALD